MKMKYRILACIEIALLLITTVVSYRQFQSKRGMIEKEFSQYNFAYNNELLDKINVNLNYTEKSPELPAYDSLDPDVIMFQFTKFYEYTDYITMAKMFDRNGSVIAESESMIYLLADDMKEAEYIYLDTCFSREQMEKVYDFKRQHRDGSIYIKNIDGVMKEGKFAPSSATIAEANSKDEIVIKTWSKLDPTLSYHRYNAVIDLAIIGWEDTKHSKTMYGRLQDRFPEIEEIKEKIDTDNGEGGMISSGYMNSFNKIEYHGETYFYEWSVACDSSYETLKTSDFWNEIKYNIIFIQVIALGLWLSIIIIVRKKEQVINQMNRNK